VALITGTDQSLHYYSVKSKSDSSKQILEKLLTSLENDFPRRIAAFSLSLVDASEDTVAEFTKHLSALWTGSRSTVRGQLELAVLEVLVTTGARAPIDFILEKLGTSEVDECGATLLAIASLRHKELGAMLTEIAQRFLVRALDLNSVSIALDVVRLMRRLAPAILVDGDIAERLLSELTGPEQIAVLTELCEAGRLTSSASSLRSLAENALHKLGDGILPMHKAGAAALLIELCTRTGGTNVLERWESRPDFYQVSYALVERPLDFLNAESKQHLFEKLCVHLKQTSQLASYARVLGLASANSVPLKTLI
jgi:hypothetical protein